MYTENTHDCISKRLPIEESCTMRSSKETLEYQVVADFGP